MDLSYLDEYFKVDKNQLVLRGHTVCFTLSCFVRNHNPNWGKTREFALKSYDWLDNKRHTSKNIEKDFFDCYGIDYNLLPKELKDFNLDPLIIPDYSNYLGKDIRYTKYIRMQWHNLRKVLVDESKFVDHDDFTTTVNGLGVISEMPFLIAYACTSAGYYKPRLREGMLKAYNKFNNDNRFCLIEAFTAATCSHIKNNMLGLWDDSNEEIKNKTLAFYLEIENAIESMKNQKMAS